MEHYMARRARKQNSKANFNNMVVELQTYRKKKITILPRNVHQEDYIAILNDTSTPIAFATGPAGTGKCQELLLHCNYLKKPIYHLL